MPAPRPPHTAARTAQVGRRHASPHLNSPSPDPPPAHLEVFGGGDVVLVGRRAADVAVTHHRARRQVHRHAVRQDAAPGRHRDVGHRGGWLGLNWCGAGAGGARGRKGRRRWRRALPSAGGGRQQERRRYCRRCCRDWVSANDESRRGGALGASLVPRRVELLGPRATVCSSPRSRFIQTLRSCRRPQAACKR